jgi:hypothetical protein
MGIHHGFASKLRQTVGRWTGDDSFIFGTRRALLSAVKGPDAATLCPSQGPGGGSVFAPARDRRFFQRLEPPTARVTSTWNLPFDSNRTSGTGVSALSISVAVLPDCGQSWKATRNVGAKRIAVSSLSYGHAAAPASSADGVMQSDRHAVAVEFVILVVAAFTRA